LRALNPGVLVQVIGRVGGLAQARAEGAAAAFFPEEAVPDAVARKLPRKLPGNLQFLTTKSADRGHRGFSTGS
jgi:hypothetical protein